MNWRISRAVAALSFLTLAFTTSCDDPTGIGLELQGPGTLIGTVFTDTSTVKASTVLLSDSIITLSSSRVMVGRVADPRFGVTTAKTYAEFGLISQNVAFDPNTGADSLVLSLDYDYYYGDTTKAATWNVYRLRQGFSDQATYFTTTDLNHDQTPIGTVTFQPRPRSTYFTVRNNNGVNDTTKNIPYLVRFRLDQTAGGRALAQEILDASDKAPLKTQQAFVSNLLAGLVIAPEAGSGNSAIYGLNLASLNSRLTLHYTSTTDNAAKSYAFQPSSRYYNRVTANRANTPLAGLDTHLESVMSTATNGLTYLQSGTGLVTKLELPYVAAFRKVPANEPQAGQSRDLAVNKAELVIPISREYLGDTTLFPKPFTVAVVEARPDNGLSRSSGGIPNVLPQEGNGSYAALEYRGKDEGFVYVVNITTYLQNVLYNKKPNNGLILLPSEITSSPSTPTNNAQTVNRIILEAQSATDPERKIKLRVFYSLAQ